MTLEEAKDDVINILDRQTIKRVRRECQRLADENDLPQFEEFLQEGTHFILTEKRAQILRGIQQGLAEQETPGVILHGAYGSGKTVMMENIALLCQNDQEYGDREFDQLHYGGTPIDCLTISLEQHDTPTEFLQALFTALVEYSSSVDEDDLLAIFNDRKINLTLEDLDDDLPPNHRQDLIDIFEDPSSLEDIARVTKSLTAGDAHQAIAWFTTYYREREDHYPAFYIDEFEQITRQGVDPGGNYRLKAIVQKMIRNTVSGFDDFTTPPYILFANTVSHDEFRENFPAAARDLTDRIDENISYNIDHSEEETKELFANLYRLYVIPLLADRGGEAGDWYDTIASAEPGEDGYVYPFTDDTLEFTLSIVQKFEDETLDETVVRAFRDYKRILISFLDHWDSEGQIDLDFLYQHGDAVRDQLRGNVERVNLDELPGEDSIEATIEADYPDASGIDIRILCEIAKTGILDRTERPVYFTTSQITNIAGSIELQIDDSEAEDLIGVATQGPEYFSLENGRLEFNPNELTGTAADEGELSLADQVGEAVTDLHLEDHEENNLIQLWADMLNHRFPDTAFENQQGQYLVFDTDQDLNYTSKVLFTVAPDDLPEQLSTEVDDDALHIVIRLGRDTEGDLPAKYYVTERNGQAGMVTDDIASNLNRNIELHIDEESGYYNLIEATQERFPRYDDYQAYVMFLKLSLAYLAGNDLTEDIRDRTADPTSFSLIQTVDSNLTNIADTYPCEKLGFTGTYPGKDYLNLVYGIKHLDREGDLIFESANHPHIDVQSFGRVNRSRESGDEFRAIVEQFADNESFIEERSNGDYDIVPHLSSYSHVLDTIEEHLDEDGLDFDEILELIFGTSEVENVTRAMVYLLLILSQYVDEYSWVFEDDNETTIIPADVRIETQRRQVRKRVGRRIKIAILDQAKQDDTDISQIEDLNDTYDSIETADATELEDIQNEIDASWDFEYQGADELLREVMANDVFVDSAVASYANTIHPLSNLDPELRYLFLDDLDHLATQVKKAATILAKKDDLEALATKLECFGTDPNLQSEGLSIECITTINDFWETHQVERNIQEADVAADLEQYLDGDIRLDRLIEMLRTQRKSIVPPVDTYDPTEDEASLDDDIRFVTDAIRDGISEEQDNVAAAKEELENYADRIPGESSWIRRGEGYLESCESELEAEPHRFDHTQYEDFWEQWETARNQLDEEAFDGDEFEETVRKYDPDIEIDVVEDATEDSISDKFSKLDDDEFQQVIDGLQGSTTAAEELKQSLLKIRVKAELTGDET